MDFLSQQFVGRSTGPGSRPADTAPSSRLGGKAVETAVRSACLAVPLDRDRSTCASCETRSWKMRGNSIRSFFRADHISARLHTSALVLKSAAALDGPAACPDRCNRQGSGGGSGAGAAPIEGPSNMTEQTKSRRPRKSPRPAAEPAEVVQRQAPFVSVDAGLDPAQAPQPESEAAQQGGAGPGIAATDRGGKPT